MKNFESFMAKWFFVIVATTFYRLKTESTIDFYGFFIVLIASLLSVFTWMLLKYFIEMLLKKFNK